MRDEDMKNLVGWLQAIYKEASEAKSTSKESRDKINLLPEIRDFIARERGGSGEIDRRIEDAKNHLENKINHLEQQMNDLRNILNELKNKLDRLN